MLTIADFAMMDNTLIPSLAGLDKPSALLPDNASQSQQESSPVRLWHYIRSLLSVFRHVVGPALEHLWSADLSKHDAFNGTNSTSTRQKAKISIPRLVNPAGLVRAMANRRVWRHRLISEGVRPIFATHWS